MPELSYANQIAHEVLAWLEPHAEQVAIAGSIRRGKPDPKDVEIVVIPRDTYFDFTSALVGSPTLFGPAAPPEAAGRVRMALYGDNGTQRWGPKYRGLQVDGVTVELFTATPHNWGYILWLRTGPGDANTYIMTMKGALGLRFYKAENGSLIDRHNKPIDVPDERTMFDLLRLPYLSPGQRSETVYRQLHQALEGGAS